MYYIDAQYGRLAVASSEISGTITTRTDAGGAIFIVEVYDERNAEPDA